MKPNYCEVCRVPAALMPCSRCVLPSPKDELSDRPERQTRPVEPILLEGKYLLLEELGRGGMGTVFRAIDKVLDRPVAVKFLLPELQALPEAAERFRREAKAMASINHQNVLKVFTFGRYGSADFMVTEFVDGPTLEGVLDAGFVRADMMPLVQALDILVQASTGLGAIHRAGVIHRDIKPGNIMFETSSRRALIMDFGIGRQVTRDEEQSTAAAGGTPAYMAPEVIVGSELNSAREHLVDIYAFGITAFEILTSRLPFNGDTWIEMLMKHLEVQPPRPSEIRKNLPDGLDEVVLKCLEKNPSKRYQTASEICNALRPFLTRAKREKTAGLSVGASAGGVVRTKTR